MTAIINFLFAAIKAGTPLLFGTTGEIVTQKAGNLNLGVEGMMYMGAFTGFYVGLTTGSLPLALLAAFGAGMLGALIYAFLTVTLKADQNVTGLTLTIFGTGFANFFGEVMISSKRNPDPGDTLQDCEPLHPGAPLQRQGRKQLLPALWSFSRRASPRRPELWPQPGQEEDHRPGRGNRLGRLSGTQPHGL